MILVSISTVNNVGMMYYTHFAYFLQVPDAEQVRLCSFLLTSNSTFDLQAEF